MKQYPVAKGIRIKKIGVFDFDNLYKFIYKWLSDHKYDFHENLYKHKPGHVYGNEVEIEIGSEKKLTSYFKNELSLKIHMWDVMDIPVIQDGKKKILTKNRIQITIDSSVITDYDNKFENPHWKQNLRSIFERFVLKKDIEDKYQYGLYKESYELLTKIKEFLDMESK